MSRRVAKMLDQTLGQLAGFTNPHVGTDLVHIPTWKRMVEAGGEPLLGRVYTPKELAFAAGRIDRLAARLAAKEAAVKVLGTGIRQGINLRQIEVRTAPEGTPSIVLHGRAAARARRLRLDGIGVSLAHELDYACAVAAGYTTPKSEDVAA